MITVLVDEAKAGTEKPALRESDGERIASKRHTERVTQVDQVRPTAICLIQPLTVSRDLAGLAAGSHFADEQSDHEQQDSDMKKTIGQITALNGQTDHYSVESDGTTVWVNTGLALIGRFGKAGIDIHHAATEQAGNSECLFCTHGWVTVADWPVFVEKMRELHGVVVPEKHRPVRFSESTTKSRGLQ